MPNDGPSFENPPVVETVLGAQFKPIPGLRNAHLGVFWDTLGAEWPEVIDAPSLQAQYEQFGDDDPRLPPRLVLGLTSDPAARIQIRSRDRDRMIQVQNGRLHYNWIATDGNNGYPRYKTVVPAFLDTLSRFERFLTDHKLDEPQLDQWEVTYVNRIPRGTVWDSSSDWVGVFPALLGPASAQPFGILENVASAWRFELPPRRGRLHIELQHAYQPGTPPGESLLLKLTARGPIAGSTSALEGGLNVGHDAVVAAFVDVTSEAARRYWGQSG